MVALVTGASRGIGKVIALELASLGYDLALVARDAAALAEVIAALPESCGNAVAIPADLTQEETYESVVGECVAQLGGLDVLVNCAGLSQAGPFEDVTPEQWDRIFAVNAKAPFFISRAALPYLKESEKPIVINIASVVGFKGYIHQSAYASSKHALTGFTKVFAKEVQPFGIRVHLISPGGVATEMVKQMRPDIKPDELIQPEEIAEIVRFLVTKKGQGTIDQFYIRRYTGLAFD
ncbi:MAG: SDR family oxidoreductase [Bacteroidales bacterium]|jgi:3-oxoacyl-[acyl-carrier protein] reductase|nr:SDR family oxidoreductase [Bacteroidales bacterium]MBO6238526.1 SDR family oxidoreductase [Bacteroidales bacterium]